MQVILSLHGWKFCDICLVNFIGLSTENIHTEIPSLEPILKYLQLSYFCILDILASIKQEGCKLEIYKIIL